MKNAAVTVVALAMTLAACDKGPEQQAVSTGTAAPVAAPEAGTARGGGDAVQAVLQSQGTPLARLQFVLDSRPVAGKPFSLQLHFSAPAPVPELQWAAESSGLIIAPDSATLAIAAADTPVVQQVIVTAPREGLVDMQVRLKGADAAETVYAVPVLVAAAASAP